MSVPSRLARLARFARLARLEGEDRDVALSELARWGAPAPVLLRAVAAMAWLALVARLVATSLPGSRSGIEQWIRRTDFAASLSAQLSVLLGGSLLVLLVVGTLADRALGYLYRFSIVPASGAILTLVMLASTLGLDPVANLSLGLSCLVLATAGASTALRFPVTRAQGLVLSLITLGAASRLVTRVLMLGTAHHDAAWLGRVAWIASVGHTFDAVALAVAAARLRAEHRNKAAVALIVVLLGACAVAWGALQGSFEGAATWQVVASRSLDELAATPVVFSTMASRYAVETMAVLLSGAVVLWPGRISAGMMTIALGLLARPGLDVPAAALVMAVAALAAPLGSAAEADGPELPAAVPSGTASRTAAGADGTLG